MLALHEQVASTTEPILIDHIVCRRKLDLSLCGALQPETSAFTEDPQHTCVVCAEIEESTPTYCPLGGVCDCATR